MDKETWLLNEEVQWLDKNWEVQVEVAKTKQRADDDCDGKNSKSQVMFQS